MTKDSGSAFPRSKVFHPKGGEMDRGEAGMTLRDWFAGMALQGMIANEQSMLDVAEKAVYLKTAPSKYIATMMYEIADAMLEERKK